MLLRNDAHMRKRDRDLRRWQGSRVDMCPSCHPTVEKRVATSGAASYILFRGGHTRDYPRAPKGLGGRGAPEVPFWSVRGSKRDRRFVGPPISDSFALFERLFGSASRLESNFTQAESIKASFFYRGNSVPASLFDDLAQILEGEFGMQFLFRVD